MTSNVKNNFVQAYNTLNRDLVRTLVIKSKYAVYAINEDLIKRFGEQAVDFSNPWSWKYYMNIAGEYHPTDSLMNVISLDTKDSITFSVENLTKHTATAEAYKQGSRFYYSLVHRYPEQEFLINCILTPSDKDAAIAAQDGAILSYDKTLVFDYERTLIHDLQDFIYRHSSRWNVEAFALTDPYYAFMQRVGLGLILIEEVSNLRLKRCKTNEVHDFHLRQYLASHHKLDRWLDYLTREQALWLYRNVLYIERNAGQTKTFASLIENILDKRGIPLVDITIKQLDEFFETYYPVVMAKRTHLTKTTSFNVDEFMTLDNLLTNELGTAYGNEDHLFRKKDEIVNLISNANTTSLGTKDLESNMLDLTNSVPDPLEEVMMRQLVFMAYNGLYKAVVNFEDPKNGFTYSLDAVDAVAYMFYLTFKAEGLGFDYMPGVINTKYRQHPRPDASVLKDLIEPGMEWLMPLAEDLVSAQPIITECTSVSMFYDLTYKVYLEHQRHWKLLAATHDMYVRGVLEQMLLKLFAAQHCDFSKGETVNAWKDRLNLPTYNYTWEEANLLIKEIFQKATGFTVDNKQSLRNIQKALIELTMTLSSYSIQIMKDINDSSIVMTGGNALRTSPQGSYIEDFVSAIIPIRMNEVKEKVEDLIDATYDTGLRMLVQEDTPDLNISTNVGISASLITEKDQLHVTTIKPIEFDIKIEITDPLTGSRVLKDNVQLHDVVSQEELKQMFFSGEY